MNTTADTKPLYAQQNDKKIEIGRETIDGDMIIRTYYLGYDDKTEQFLGEAQIDNGVLSKRQVSIEATFTIDNKKTERKLFGKNGKPRKLVKYNDEGKITEQNVFKGNITEKVTFEYDKQYLLRKNSFHEDGQTLLSEETFNKRRQISKFKQFDEKGAAEFTIDYDYFENGVLKEKTHFEGDQQNLIQTETFNEKGFLEAKINHKNQDHDSSSQRFFYGESHQLEKLIEYRDESKHLSKVKEFDDKQQVSKLKIYQRDGRNIGVEIEFHPNGKKKKETFFKNKTSLPVKIVEFDEDEKLQQSMSIRYNGRKKKKVTIAQKPYEKGESSHDQQYTKIVKLYHNNSGNPIKGDVYDPYGNIIMSLFYNHKTNERLDTKAVTEKRSSLRTLAFILMTLGAVCFLVGVMTEQKQNGIYGLILTEILAAIIYLLSEKMAVHSAYKKHKIIPEEVSFDSIEKKVETAEENKKIYKQNAKKYMAEENKNASLRTKENIDDFKKTYFVKTAKYKMPLYQELLTKSFRYFTLSQDFAKTQRDIHQVLRMVSDWNNAFDVQNRDMSTYKTLYQDYISKQKTGFFSKAKIEDFVEEFAVYYKGIRPLMGPSVLKAGAAEVEAMAPIAVLLLAEKELTELEKTEF